MNKAINRLRLFFCSFSGEDDYIIRQCGKRVQISFALIGFIVIIIFIACGTSAYFFMSHLFQDMIWLAFLTGIIWGLLVTNLYLLMLYTISPALLPVANKSKRKKNDPKIIEEAKKITPESPFTFSLFFRISLIELLAIIIIQPFNLMIFSTSAEISSKYAETLRHIFSRHPNAWLITIVGCTIFLLPVYWKYAIRNKGGFYEKKRHIENKFVHDNYIDSKVAYESILKDRINSYNEMTWKTIIPLLNKLENLSLSSYRLHYQKLKSEIINEPITKYEYWADPPFRTTKKNEKSLSSEEDFLKNIYSQNT